MGPIDARHLSTLIAGTLGLLAAIAHAGGVPGLRKGERIDRFRLVSRHNVALTAPNLNAPLNLGDGEFAFNADVTGLQTFDPSGSNPGSAKGSNPWENRLARQRRIFG